MRWATQAPVAFASLMNVGVTIQECESWIDVPGRMRLLGIVGNCVLMKVPNGSIKTFLS